MYQVSSQSKSITDKFPHKESKILLFESIIEIACDDIRVNDADMRHQNINPYSGRK